MVLAPLSWNMRHQLNLTARDYADKRIYNPHYVVYAVEVTGMLALDRVAKAWIALQRRHHILVAAFDLENEAIQCTPGEAAPIQVIYWDRPESENSGATPAALDVLSAALRAPFDLTRGPLARLLVLPVGPERTLIGIAVEHVVADGWSLHQLISEFWALYEFPHADLPTPAMSFMQQIRGENEWLASADGARFVASWTNHLDGLGPLPRVELRGIKETRGRPALAVTGHLDFALNPDRTSAVQSRVRSAGLTVGGLVQAAFSAALATEAGVERLGVVLSLANRSKRDVRHTVGWLSNKIVVPANVQRGRTASDFLSDFSENLSTALDYGDIPFGKVLYEMEPELFGASAMYPWVGFNPMPVSMGRYFSVTIPRGLDVSPVPVTSGWNEKSLVAYATVVDGHLEGSIDYKPYWYEEETVRSLANTMMDFINSWTS